MKKLIIALFALLLLTSCGQETIVSPVREEIKAAATNLGIKKSDSKPVILINDGEDTLYIGETDFEFDVEAYSDNGEVTISFDDSAVDYQKEGSYQIKILVEDPFEQGEDNTDLTLKKKTAPVVNSDNSGAGNSSGGTSGCYRTNLGIFCSWADYVARANYEYSRGGLSERNWTGINSYSDWPGGIEAWEQWRVS